MIFLCCDGTGDLRGYCGSNMENYQILSLVIRYNKVKKVFPFKVGMDLWNAPTRFPWIHLLHFRHFGIPYLQSEK